MHGDTKRSPVVNALELVALPQPIIPRSNRYTKPDILYVKRIWCYYEIPNLGIVGLKRQDREVSLFENEMTWK